MESCELPDYCDTEACLAPCVPAPADQGGLFLSPDEFTFDHYSFLAVSLLLVLIVAAGLARRAFLRAYLINLRVEQRGGGVPTPSDVRDINRLFWLMPAISCAAIAYGMLRMFVR